MDLTRMQKPAGRFLVAIGYGGGKPMSVNELIQSVAHRNEKLYPHDEAESALSVLKAHNLIDNELALTVAGTGTFNALKAHSRPDARYHKFFRPSLNPNVGLRAPKSKTTSPVLAAVSGITKVR